MACASGPGKKDMKKYITNYASHADLFSQATALRVLLKQLKHIISNSNKSKLAVARTHSRLGIQAPGGASQVELSPRPSKLQSAREDDTKAVLSWKI